MKKIKKIVIVFLVLVLLLVGSLTIYLQTTKPQYEGEVAINNISNETNVYFDTYGVPHIYAENQKDAIQCVVSNVLENSIDFGKTQQPNLLDYADGIDTMAFLNS